MKKVNVVVKKEFIDRYTGVKHVPDEKMTVTDARLREIRRSGDYVTVVQAAVQEQKKEK